MSQTPGSAPPEPSSSLGRRSFLTLCGGLTAQGLLCSQSAEAGTCGAPPKASPHRWKGGEGVAPLPGPPATPLRRSEKKRPPTPPTLIGKIEYGKLVQATDDGGHQYTYRDWTTDPADMQGLMECVRKAFAMDYKGIRVQLNKFSWDPTEIPILYLTGHEGFEFDEELRKRLAWFLQDGGTLIGDACCGRKEYRESFLREMNALFPRRKMERMPEDHPLFTAYHKLEEVGFVGEDQRAFRGVPFLEAVHIGCRAAVLFSPYDLSCAWDGHRHESGRRVWSEKHGPEDAERLGVNMVGYCLASYQQGRQLAVSKRYHEAKLDNDEKFVFGQIIHGGDWDPDPDGAAALLKYLAANTALGVRFKREAVDLTKLDTFNHPILYLTGHSDFTFNDEEISTLRKYLQGAGVLFADACCSRKAFDSAFRREIRRVLPGGHLEALPLSASLYRATGTPLAEASFTPCLKQEHPDWSAPRLEGEYVNGSLAVIYSPLDIGCGWEDAEHPYGVGYDRKTALRLGACITLHAMTH